MQKRIVSVICAKVSVAVDCIGYNFKQYVWMEEFSWVGTHIIFISSFIFAASSQSFLIIIASLAPEPITKMEVIIYYLKILYILVNKKLINCNKNIFHS